MPITFLRDPNGEPPEQDEDVSACVTVKDKNGDVMHIMLRKGARVRPSDSEPQKAEAEPSLNDSSLTSRICWQVRGSPDSQSPLNIPEPYALPQEVVFIFLAPQIHPLKTGNR